MKRGRNDQSALPRQEQGVNHAFEEGAAILNDIIFTAFKRQVETHKRSLKDSKRVKKSTTNSLQHKDYAALCYLIHSKYSTTKGHKASVLNTLRDLASHEQNKSKDKSIFITSNLKQDLKYIFDTIGAEGTKDIAQDYLNIYHSHRQKVANVVALGLIGLGAAGIVGLLGGAGIPVVGAALASAGAYVTAAAVGVGAATLVGAAAITPILVGVAATVALVGVITIAVGLIRKSNGKSNALNKVQAATERYRQQASYADIQSTSKSGNKQEVRKNEPFLTALRPEPRSRKLQPKAERKQTSHARRAEAPAPDTTYMMSV